jgi:WD40 repeat protein
MLAIAGSAESVCLFDTSGAHPFELGVLPGIDQEIHSLTFSPDSTTLALAGLEDGSVRLWDVRGDQPQAKGTLKRPEAVDVTAGRDDRNKAAIEPPAIARQREGAISTAFAPDGRSLAALEQGGHVRLWDLSKHEPADRGLLKLRGDNMRPVPYGLGKQAMVAFSPDGKTLAATQFDGWIRLWDLRGDEHAERDTWRPLSRMASR